MGKLGEDSFIERNHKRRKPVMNRDDVVARLKKLEPLLKKQGIEGLYLYGSFARDTADETSDIDIFADPEQSHVFGFDAFMSSFELLKSSFPDRDLGYSTRDGLVEPYKHVIEPTALQEF